MLLFRHIMYTYIYIYIYTYIKRERETERERERERELWKKQIIKAIWSAFQELN